MELGKLLGDQIGEIDFDVLEAGCELLPRGGLPRPRGRFAGADWPVGPRSPEPKSRASLSSIRNTETLSEVLSSRWTPATEESQTFRSPGESTWSRSLASTATSGSPG